MCTSSHKRKYITSVNPRKLKVYTFTFLIVSIDSSILKCFSFLLTNTDLIWLKWTLDITVKPNNKALFLYFGLLYVGECIKNRSRGYGILVANFCHAKGWLFDTHRLVKCQTLCDSLTRSWMYIGLNTMTQVWYFKANMNRSIIEHEQVSIETRKYVRIGGSRISHALRSLISGQKTISSKISAENCLNREGGRVSNAPFP